MSAPALGRRALLQSAGALIVSVGLTGPSHAGEARPTAGRPPLLPTQLDSWIALKPDGAGVLYFGKTDVGQGIDVAMAQIVAEELDMNPARFTVVMGDTLLTVDQGGTSGSTGVSRAGAAFRVAGAEARRILLARAAQRLGAPIARLQVADGVVSVIGRPAKRVTYAALLSDGFFREPIGWNNKYGSPLGLTGPATPKTPDQYKVVGQPVPRHDVAGKVFGTDPYVTDIRLPGMLHGRMIRPPVAGTVPVHVDETSIAGLGARVVRKGDLIAVVAEKEWSAVKAARDLTVTWSAAADVFPDQAGLYDALRKAPAAKRQASPSDVGDIDAALAGAARVIEADYEWPFQSHASLGGACAVADVRADGVTVWTATQKPHYCAQGVAKILGLAPDSVRAIWTAGPGSYGRNDAGDAALDAAVLSQAVGRPVRVQYMRHEGTGWDPKAPPSTHRMRAGLDAEGNVVALDQQIKGLSRTDVSFSEAEPGDTLAGQLLGFERAGVPGFGAPEEPYGFAARRTVWEVAAPLLKTASPLRTAHLRDPLGPQLNFASESFIDEVAAAAGSDPVAFRLRYLTRPRDVAVIKAAAERARWQAGPAGARRGRNGDRLTGRGFAYGARGETVMAMVIDVEIEPATGALHVPRIVLAHDCGLIVNPGILKTVLEGNVLQGLSRAIHEEVLFSRRAVTSVDWETYPILDVADAPAAIDIVMIDRPEVAPSGAGEGAIRIVAAALGNAIFEASGRRMRQAPLNAERVRQALA